jgi:hypothetical protein
MLLKSTSFCSTHKSSVSAGFAEQIIPSLYSLGAYTIENANSNNTRRVYRCYLAMGDLLFLRARMSQTCLQSRCLEMGHCATVLYSSIPPFTWEHSVRDAKSLLGVKSTVLGGIPYISPKTAIDCVEVWQMWVQEMCTVTTLNAGSSM